MQLPVRVEVKYGKTSSSEHSREVSTPTSDELSALLREMARIAAIINVQCLDTEEVLQVSPRKDSSVPKLQWELGWFDEATRTRFELACNSQELAVQLVVEWATSESRQGPFFGGYEWSSETFPEMDEHGNDALFFDFESEPLVPVDRQAAKMPTFIDAKAVLPSVKQTLADAWKNLSASIGVADVFAFGLDRLGEGFLVVVGYRNEAGENPEIDELYIEVAEANEMVSEAIQSIEDWESEMEIDSTPSYNHMVATMYEVGVTALQQLRAEGVFSETPNVILNVWHRENEPHDADTVARCNPPEVAALMSAGPRWIFST